jgi:GNAT superfamily N-acetyltransferase
MQWRLRAATPADRDFLFTLHEAAMRPYVDATWGWDDAEQKQMFDRSFDPANQEIIDVAGKDTGMLAVEETADEIWLGVIEIHPNFQGRGLGADIIRSVLDRGAAAGSQSRCAYSIPTSAPALFTSASVFVPSERSTRTRIFAQSESTVHEESPTERKTDRTDQSCGAVSNRHSKTSEASRPSPDTTCHMDGNPSGALTRKKWLSAG